MTEQEAEEVKQQVLRQRAERRLQGVGLSLKTYISPALDATAEKLSSFDINFQYRVAQIRSRIDIINQQIDQYYFFYEKTFDSTLTPENHAHVVENTFSAYGDVKTQLRETVNSITALLAEKKDWHEQLLERLKSFWKAS